MNKCHNDTDSHSHENTVLARLGPLSDEERKEKADIEAMLKTNSVQMAIGLGVIDEKWLWREDYTNFHDYLLTEWNMPWKTYYRWLGFHNFKKQCHAKGIEPPRKQSHWEVCASYTDPMEAYVKGTEAGCKTADDYQAMVDTLALSEDDEIETYPDNQNEPLTKIHLHVFSRRDANIVKKWEDWRLLEGEDELFIFRTTTPTATQHEWMIALLDLLIRNGINKCEYRTKL